jgi:hypothetical protein
MIDCSMIGKVITHVGIFIRKQQTKNSAHLVRSKMIEYEYKERLVLFAQCNTNDYSWSFLFSTVSSGNSVEVEVASRCKTPDDLVALYAFGASVSIFD